jgi:ATP-dependent 26S proteasome regulatory subunit
MHNEISVVQTIPASTFAKERQIEILVRSGYPIIYVTTWEERRALETLRRVAESVGVPLQAWTVSEGLISEWGGVKKADSLRILDDIMAYREPSIFVLQDYHYYMNEPIVTRKLRDAVAAFRWTHRTLIILSPVFTLPVELEKDITLVDYELPPPEELMAVLERVIKQAHDLQLIVELDDDGKEKLVKAMQGLTESQAENVLGRCLVMDRKLDIEDLDTILHEKEQIIKKSGILEFYSSPEDFESIGGLEVLKDWFNKRKDAFTERAHQFGLPAPKGILLTGVPGCGKSLCAKALAAEWDKPLLRLDVGRIFGGLVGQSEENMRIAIKVAESVAPAILWIDEIEKGFAGMQGRGDGGGVVSRVFGTLITWMQEKIAPVFVIATANDISQLPPELVRKGRFDEMFFVDLPFEDEREEIFRIHIRKCNRDPNDYALREISQATYDFSGAEIEQVVISALYDAFSNGTELTDELLLKTIRETTPLSKTMEIQIDALRNWAETRCRYASARRRESAGRGTYLLDGDRGFSLFFPREQQE